jgi:hypothetical protein
MRWDVSGVGEGDVEPLRRDADYGLAMACERTPRLIGPGESLPALILVAAHLAPPAPYPSLRPPPFS